MIRRVIISDEEVYEITSSGPYQKIELLLEEKSNSLYFEIECIDCIINIPFNKVKYWVEGK